MWLTPATGTDNREIERSRHRRNEARRSGRRDPIPSQPWHLFVAKVEENDSSHVQRCKSRFR